MSIALLLDRFDGRPRWGAGDGPDVLVVPAEGGALCLQAGAPPSWQPLVGSQAGQAGQAAQDGQVALRVEPLEQGALLVLPEPGLRWLLDGRAAGPVLRCRPGQRLDLPPQLALHLSLLLGGAAVPPSATQLGEPCPVCRLPFAAHTRVWSCARCATALHWEGDEVPEAERLVCVELQHVCPCCGDAIRRAGGLRHVPCA